MEELKNKLKVLKRISYGYRNHSNYVSRILLTTKLFIHNNQGMIKEEAA
ncbi:transposase [Aerococcus suis]